MALKKRPRLWLWRFQTCPIRPMIGLIVAVLSIDAGCAGPTGASAGQPAGRDQLTAELKGDLDEARRRLTLAQARRADRQGDWAALERLAKRLWHADDPPAEAGYLWGKVLGHQARPKKQVSVFRSARAIDARAVPTDAYVKALGEAIRARERGDSEKRRLALREELLRLAPDHPAASAGAIRANMAALMRQCMEHKRWPAALETYQLLAVGSSDRRDRGQLTYWRAIALWHVGQKRRAREEFGHFINSAEADAQRGLAWRVATFYRDRHAMQPAVEFGRRALGCALDWSTAVDISKYLDLGRWALAAADADLKEWGETCLRDILQNLPVQAHRLKSRARKIARDAGLTVPAAKPARQSRSAHNGAGIGRLHRMYVEYVESGEQRKARAVLQRFMKAHPLGGGRVVARWARSQGQWETAYRYIQRATDRLERGSWRWKSAISIEAKVALKLGDKAGARQALTTYLDAEDGQWRHVWDNSRDRLLKKATTVDQYVAILDAYQKKHPRYALAVTSDMIAALIQHDELQRVEDTLRRAVEGGELSRDDLELLIDTTGGRLGWKMKYRLFMAIGEHVDPQGFFTAARFAVKQDDMQRFDASVDRFLAGDAALRKRCVAVVQLLMGMAGPQTSYSRRKTMLLERILDAPGPGDDFPYTMALMYFYVEAGRVDEAVALWPSVDDPPTAGPFSDESPPADKLFDDYSYHSRSLSPRARAELVEAYEQHYPDNQASTWLVFLMAEQCHSLFRARAVNRPRSQSTEALRRKARRLYALAFDRAPHNKDVLKRASNFLDDRNFPGLAERAFVERVRARPRQAGPWFAYASFLLRHSRSEAAEQVFRRYVEQTAHKGSAALSVAKRFRNAQRHDREERFLKMALASGQDSDLEDTEKRAILKRVGPRLGKLYLDHGRVDDFLELTSDYYAKVAGIHPLLDTDDRSIDLDGLKGYGLWKPYVARIGMAPVDPESLDQGIAYGKALWYLGRSDDAMKAFEESIIDRQRYPGSQWWAVAHFLESHGGAVEAATAYDRAARLEPRQVLRRASYLVRRGHYRAAIDDYIEAARGSDSPSGIRKKMFAALGSVGRAELARRVVERPNSPFQTSKKPARQQVDFRGVARSEAVERAKKLIGAGEPIDEIVQALANQGFNRAIATLIGERLANKNFDVASSLVVAHADALAQVDELDPLVSQLTGYEVPDGAGLPVPFLRAYYVRHAQIRRALAIGPKIDQRSLLAANSLAATKLASQRSSGRAAGTSGEPIQIQTHRHASPLAVEFLRLDEHAALTSLANQVARPMPQKARRDLTATRIADLLGRSGPSAVVSLLRQTGLDLAKRLADDRAVGPEFDAINTLYNEARVLAASGYADETRQWLATLPERVAELRGMSSLASRLRQSPDRESGAQAAAEPANLRGSRVAKSEIERLLRQSHNQQAEALLRAGFDGMIGRDADVDIAVDGGSHFGKWAFQKLLRLYQLTDRADKVDHLIDLWRHKVGPAENEDLVQNLEDVALVGRAADVAGRSAETFRTKRLWNQAMETALIAGDPDVVENTAPKFWRYAGSHQAARIARWAIESADPRAASVLVERVARAHPKDPRARIDEIIAQLGSGHVDRGRALIGQFVDEFTGRGNAVVDLVDRLHSHGFHVETARTVGPRLADVAGGDGPADDLLVRLARANAYIGRADQAADFLDTLVDRSAASELRAAQLSRQFTLAGHQTLGMKLAKRAFSEGGRLRASFLARGLAKLANHADGAAADLDHGCRGRRIDARWLSNIAQVALRADDFTVAEDAITRLVRLPTVSGRGQGHPLVQAVQAIRSAHAARWGVNLLDRLMPRLMTRPYLIDRPYWTQLIGQLLVDAHFRRRAERWYRRASEYLRLGGSRTPTYWQFQAQRAANLIINGGDLDRAGELIRGAFLFGHLGANDGLITLTRALLDQRRGQFDRAAALFRQAARAGYRRADWPDDPNARLQSILEHTRSLWNRREDDLVPLDPPSTFYERALHPSRGNYPALSRSHRFNLH